MRLWILTLVIPTAALICLTVGWTRAGWILLGIYGIGLVGLQFYVGKLDARSQRLEGEAEGAWRRRILAARRARRRRREEGSSQPSTRGQVPEPPSREARLGRAMDGWPPDG